MPSNKIRLLHLIKSLDLGGIEKSTVLYSNLLQEKLDFVGIYATKGFYDKTDFVNENIKRYYPPNNIWEKSFFFNNLKHIHYVIKKEQITHLHYHHRIFIPFILLLKITCPQLEIIYTHHNIFNDIVNNFIISDKIIALNNSTKHDLPKRFKEKIVILPHAVQLNKKLKLMERIPRSIGYVGRFVEYKGLLKLIWAFKKVNSKLKNTILIFVGDGPYKNKMISEINILKTTQNVIFKKTSISENEIYSGIDILVLPSEKLEGFGLVILEAMSFGIPVITFNIGVFREIIKDGINGMICKSNTSEELSQKIINITKDNNLYQKLQAGGYSTVTKKYNLEVTIDQMIKFYSN